MKTVEDVLLEVIGVCETLNLDYAILGGLAVRVHGIPRPTYDVDFELSVNDDELSAFFAGCENLGYEVGSAYRTGWRDTVGGMPLVKMATYIATGRTIDVDIFINSTPFQKSIMRRRIRVPFEERVLWFTTPEDLILLKLLADRPRDRGDVADVLFVQGQLDEVYLRHWADQLAVSDRLVEALASNL